MPTENTNYSMQYTSNAPTFGDQISYNNNMAAFEGNILGEFLLGTNQKDKRDWARSEQSADWAFQRDLYKLGVENEFNAVEAQKNRDFQERMRDTEFTSKMEQMKQAGINPVLAFGTSGAGVPSGSSASSGSGGSSSGNYGGSTRANNAGSMLSAIIQGISMVAGGIYGVTGSALAGGLTHAISERRIRRK